MQHPASLLGQGGPDAELEHVARRDRLVARPRLHSGIILAGERPPTRPGCARLGAAAKGIGLISCGGIERNHVEAGERCRGRAPRRAS